eukprot:TRINITY_DN5334_c0_g1_i1.p1 TRINITY_DN5334_c0_g1~~TRINITY_DN5334_c0_g1_i1.p1  ORF type:complete len:198 (-),score=40.87 TRINITY_DN5334_c0_g1_i1:242-835(-)
MEEVKCVVVGDGGVGKTCMLIAYTQQKFPEDYIPTVFDNYEALINFEGKEVKFSLWDTAGQEGYARIRTLSYPRTDIFLLCYSVVNPTSFVNVKDRWCRELQHLCPTTPIILVGTQIDLRNNEAKLKELKNDGIMPLTQSDGQSKATEIKALKYLECSALTRDGLKQVFDEALTTVMHHRAAVASGAVKKNPFCLLL